MKDFPIVLYCFKNFRRGERERGFFKLKEGVHVGTKEIFVKPGKGDLEISVARLCRRCHMNKRFNEVKTNQRSDEAENSQKFNFLETADNACKIIGYVIKFPEKGDDILIVMKSSGAKEGVTRKPL